MKERRREEKRKKKKRKGMELVKSCIEMYGNLEYGMLCFCMELVLKCLYGY